MHECLTVQCQQLTNVRRANRCRKLRRLSGKRRTGAGEMGDHRRMKRYPCREYVARIEKIVRQFAPFRRNEKVVETVIEDMDIVVGCQKRGNCIRASSKEPAFEAQNPGAVVTPHVSKQYLQLQSLNVGLQKMDISGRAVFAENISESEYLDGLLRILCARMQHPVDTLQIRTEGGQSVDPIGA